MALLSDHPTLHEPVIGMLTAAERMAVAKPVKDRIYAWNLLRIAREANDFAVWEQGMSGRAWKRRAPATRTAKVLDTARFKRKHRRAAEQSTTWVDRVEIRGELPAVEAVVPGHLLAMEAVPEQWPVGGPSLSVLMDLYQEIQDIVRDIDGQRIECRDALRAAVVAGYGDPQTFAEPWCQFEDGYAFMLGRNQFDRFVAWERFPEQTAPFTQVKTTVTPGGWQLRENFTVGGEDDDGQAGVG